jgi:probable rRNA maturation factor
VNVYFSDEQDRPVDGDSLRALAERVLVAEGLPLETEVSLMLVGPEEMASYQERFMGRSGPTDVLAFPLVELLPGSAPRRVANEPPIALGDVFVCPSVVASRITEEGLDSEDYGLERLVVHGILHLLGYDHADDHSAETMERREDELLGMGR